MWLIMWFQWTYENVNNMAASGESFSSIVKGGIRSFFEYDTPKIVHIKSIKVGLMNRFIQLLILGYVIG